MLQQRYFVLSVLFLPIDFDLLGDHGVDGAAYVIGLDRELPGEPAVDEDAKLDFCGPAEIQQGVECGADRAARPEHIVDEDDSFVFDGKGDIGAVDLVKTGADIVAIKGDIQFSVVDSPGVYQGAELLNDTVGEIDPTGLDADENGIFELEMIFEQLVRQALDGDLQLLFVQNDLQEREIFIKIGQKNKPPRAFLLYRRAKKPGPWKGSRPTFYTNF